VTVPLGDGKVFLNKDQMITSLCDRHRGLGHACEHTHTRARAHTHTHTHTHTRARIRKEIVGGGATHKRGDVRLWNLVLGLHSPHHLNELILRGTSLHPPSHVNSKLFLDASLRACAVVCACVRACVRVVARIVVLT